MEVFTLMLPLHVSPNLSWAEYQPLHTQHYRYKGVDYDSLCKHMTHLIFFSIEVAADGSFAAMDR